MQDVDVTPKVWDRILSVRAGHGCLCDPDWSEGEKQALSIYGALAQPKSSGQVIGQIGQSLDGRIATVSGDAKDISGKDGLVHLHRLRALSDAVVIGVKTALHDNPRLTVRMVEGENPVRVIIDPNGRMPDDIGLMQDRSAHCIVIQSVDKARPDHVEVITLPCTHWISPAQILNALQQRGLNRILIEGGGITIAKFLEANLLTHLHVAVAPLLIGAGPQGLTTSPVERLSQALRPRTDVYGLGSDVLFDCAFEPASAQIKPYPLPCRAAVHTN
ncbi:RibD family protein [Ruegeria lacuscaerulensis]|uniref:RibD family protein n=1 Tax=Ruegeria lacuscaerulensis TaxID=55218 RepID=UPI00147D226F|nr:RibD family protein [Ruegeria lacuscaerulensis]